MVLSDIDKANLLNTHLGSIFTYDNNKFDLSPLPASVPSDMNTLFFTPGRVSAYIRRLKSKGSAVPDGLPAVFFKNTSANIVFPLSVIFNISVQTSYLPDIWHSAIVTPVFKKGSPSNPANYRPISLTCIACKLLECGVKDVLLDHFMKHKLITRHQHGFLKKRSTATQLNSLT